MYSIMTQALFIEIRSQQKPLALMPNNDVVRYYNLRKKGEGIW